MNRYCEKEKAYRELLFTGFCLILKYPNCDLPTWSYHLCVYSRDILEEVYGYGYEGRNINNGIVRLWHEAYYDEETNQQHTFQEWANIIKTSEDVQQWQEQRYETIMNKMQ